MSKEPLFKKDYTYNKPKDRYEPLLEVKIGTKENKKSIRVLVDTGCSTDISLTKKFITDNQITLLNKMNIKPVPIGVADGHSLNADLYKAICNIEGVNKEVDVCVIDPETFFREEKPQYNEPTPVIGRGVLESYDVVFEGKNKRLCFYYPKDDEDVTVV